MTKREERVYLTYMLQPWSIIEEIRAGTQGKDLGAGTKEGTKEALGGVLLTGLLLMVCSTCFPTHPRDTCLGVAPPTMGLVLQHESPIKRVTNRLAYMPV